MEKIIALVIVAVVIVCYIGLGVLTALLINYLGFWTTLT